MLGVGDSAPDFELMGTDGRRQALREFSSTKPVLFTLFKISCPTCQLTLPYLERLAQNGTVELVAISQDDAEATEEFRLACGITFPTLLDEARAGFPVSNAFGITHVPSLFLVEPGGIISMAFEGFSKPDLLEVGRLAGISPFLENESVPDWQPG